MTDTDSGFNFSIIHKGGKVLWSRTLMKINGNPINQLIKNALLQERSGETFYVHDCYKMHWLLANEFELVFVVVYQKILQLLYLDDLLLRVKEAFCTAYGSVLSKVHLPLIVEEFDAKFNAILREVEEESESKRKKNEPSRHNSPNERIERTNNGSIVERTQSELKEQEPEKEDQLLKKLSSKKIVGRKGTSAPPVSSSSSSSKKKPEVKRTKVLAQSWTNEPKVSISSEVNSNEVDRALEIYLPEGEIEPTLEWEPSDDSSSEEEDTKNTKHKKSNGFFKLFEKIPFKSKVLQPEDIEPLLVQMRERLVTKNVAAEIADKICESVKSNLIGTTLGGLNKLSTKVREAMEQALVRILTPKVDINILRGVDKARKERRPYTIVFCGVNGVGKSTNLAKICYWLKHNNLKVMIAACDTFRSGAVEQLRVHSRCLDVPLFERGYNKDAASIAAEGIAQGKKEGMDVVLIDTAGRMQDNEPLMRSLSKLINMNEPDLILFVGEALVGNDAVDQIMKFNGCLRDLSDKPVPRLIDGIVLTKFDTIDDKVGAAISMVYSTGQPIVFVGVGQTYTDLKKLNASVVVDHLLC